MFEYGQPQRDLVAVGHAVFGSEARDANLWFRPGRAEGRG